MGSAQQEGRTAQVLGHREPCSGSLQEYSGPGTRALPPIRKRVAFSQASDHPCPPHTFVKPYFFFLPRFFLGEPYLWNFSSDLAGQEATQALPAWVTPKLSTTDLRVPRDDYWTSPPLSYPAEPQQSLLCILRHSGPCVAMPKAGTQSAPLR